jgi:hypothetical protein
MAPAPAPTPPPISPPCSRVLSDWEQPRLPARATVKHEMAMKRPVEFIIPSYLEVLDDANVHCADEAIVKLTGKRPASKFYWKFGLSPIAVVAPVVISVVMLSVVVVVHE